MSQFSDMAPGGWVARLPQRWQPYLLLARLDRPIGVWLLLLPGVWALAITARGRRLIWLLALFGLGAILMRGAGCVVNDIWDRDLDRKVTRTASRPLAAGTLTVWQAAVFLAVLLATSLLILLQLNALAIGLGVGSLGLVALYPLAKRVTWWPQLMLGITFGWGAPMGYAAGAGHLDAGAALLYVAAIVWILGFDTIYAHQDREDDALIGVRSTARLFAGHTRPFLVVCYGAMLLLLAAAGARAGLSAAFFVLLAGAGALLARQILLLDIDKPAVCLRLFKANRDVGLLIGLGILAGRL